MERRSHQLEFHDLPSLPQYCFNYYHLYRDKNILYMIQANYTIHKNITQCKRENKERAKHNITTLGKVSIKRKLLMMQKEGTWPINVPTNSFSYLFPDSLYTFTNPSTPPPVNPASLQGNLNNVGCERHWERLVETYTSEGKGSNASDYVPHDSRCRRIRYVECTTSWWFWFRTGLLIEDWELWWNGWSVTTGVPQGSVLGSINYLDIHVDGLVSRFTSNNIISEAVKSDEGCQCVGLDTQLQKWPEKTAIGF